MFRDTQGLSFAKVNIMDGQEIAALAIVAAAAAVIGKRLYNQIRGFGAKSGGCSSGCGGCGSASSTPADKPAPPLIQIQTSAPRRIQRPPAKL
jgi:hypothetical protein